MEMRRVFPAATPVRNASGVYRSDKALVDPLIDRIESPLLTPAAASDEDGAITQTVPEWVSRWKRCEWDAR